MSNNRLEIRLRFFLPHFSAGILFGLALLVAPAYADGEAEDVSRDPSAGEFSVRGYDETGAPDSPIHYRYAYGPGEADPDSETKLVRGILDALPPKLGAPHFIDIFAEDTPAGRAEGESIATRLRGIARSLEPSSPENARLEFVVVSVPTKSAGAEKALKNAAKIAERTPFGTEFRRAIRRPLSYETGTVIGTYRAITTFSTWIATGGVHPLQAIGVTAFETVVSTFHATCARSISGAFALNLNKLGGPAAGTRTVFMRRQIYALIISEIERLVTGTPKGADPIDTWQGQAQIMSVSLVIGGLDAMFAGVRDEKFLEDPIHFARLYLANFFILTPWQLMDGAGTFPVLLDLTVYKIRGSTIAMLLTYFGMYQSVSRAPNKVAFVLDSVFGPVEHAIGSVKRVIGQSCRSLFHRPIDGV